MVCRCKPGSWLTLLAPAGETKRITEPIAAASGCLWSLAMCEGAVAEDNRFMTYKTRKTASQKLSGIGFVVALHAIGIYFVASGLAHQAVQEIMGPIETKVIEEAKPKQEELPPPPPKLQTPPPYVPPPDLDVAMDAPPPSTNSTAIAAVTKNVAPPAPPAPDTEPRLDPKWRGNKIPDSAYPPTSVRLCEQGDAVLTFLVQTDGRIGEVRLDKSTGFQRIDEFGVDYIQKNWRFLPGMKEGKPITSWKTMRIVFKITGCK